MYSASGTLIPVVVNEGDTILYSKHAAKQDYNIDDEDYIEAMEDCHVSYSKAYSKNQYKLYNFEDDYNLEDDQVAPI